MCVHHPLALPIVIAEVQTSSCSQRKWLHAAEVTREPEILA